MQTHECGVREALIERQYTLEERDLLVAERDLEGFDVGLEMLDLASADDGENVWRFLHHVCNGD